MRGRDHLPPLANERENVTLTDPVMALLQRLADDIASFGYTATVEYPGYLDITHAASGEVVHFGDVNDDWSFNTVDGMESFHTDVAADTVDFTTVRDALVEGLDAFFWRGNYPTAAARRLADRQEHEARNRGGR